VLILFGNAAPIADAPEGLSDAAGATLKPASGNDAVTVTVARAPEHESVVTILSTVTSTWAHAHSTEPPTWVASDNHGVALVLASTYQCPVKDLNEAMMVHDDLIKAKETSA
jgi:hypothetical protein